MTNDFFPPRYQNFYGCELVISFSDNQEPAFIVDLHENGTLHVEGYAIEIIKELSKYFNYTITYNPFIYNRKEYYKQTVKPDLSLLLLEISAVNDVSRNDLSHPIHMDQHFIAITRGELYTPFEKLFMPFELEVWICFVTTFIISVITILVLKLLPRNIQTFVFGKRIWTPLMNLA